MAELGGFALVFALMVGLYATTAAVLSRNTRKFDLLRSAENGVLVSFALLSIAAVALVYAFVTRDFSIEYVASYSSRDLPMFYTLTAFWAGQKGSLLFWAWILGLFATIVVLQNRRANRELMPYVIGVLGVVLVFFVALLVFVTPPFEHLAVTPPDGHGLNPMLQNPGMIIHPPTLYLGYVGFTIPFAFAIAALISGRLGDQWIRTTRRWTIFSWFLLTWGNLFGAQWAYVELGWGGFWMWDPVESASFLPWLTGTAFLHSVMIQEKKNMLKVWNMFLIIITFALTMFGTFLTRSGILSSVHTFGESTLGPLFLGFIGVVLVFSFGLLASRIQMLRSRNELDSVVSRESTFLMNNVLFMGAAFAVFWGTIFPLISEAVRGVKITVGAPFFNQVNIPIFLGLLALSGICPLIAWRKASINNLRRNFMKPAVFGLSVGVVLFGLGMRHIYALISFALSGFVVATIAYEFYRGTRARRSISGNGWLRSFSDLIGRNHRRYGGYVIHFGVVLFFIGATGKAFVQETKAVLKAGESAQVGDYTLTFRGISTYTDRNRLVIAAPLEVTKGGKPIGILTPEKRRYGNSDQLTTEAAIRSTLIEDLFVVLGDIEGERAGFKFIINPLMVWLWISGFVITVGTMVAVWPDKQRRGPATGRYAREEKAKSYATVA